MIDVERDAGVVTVTIDRPEAMNALDVETLTELRDRLLELRDEPEARVVVLTGAGDRAFVAGADIKYMSRLGVEEAKRWGGLGHEAAQLLETMPKPTVAAINEALQGEHGENLLGEADIFGELFASDDAKEGMSAFVEKRAPEFKGR